jgi:hypothetical protein
VNLDMGATAIRASDWAAARKELEEAIAAMNDTTPLDEFLAAHALLGRACTALEDHSAAAAAYGVVRAKWNGTETAHKIVKAAGNSKTMRKQRLRRALLAVGEAYYSAAEQKRKAANALAAPSYSGPWSKENVDKYVAEQLGQWSKERKRLMDEAEADYAKINDVKPAPPPRWVVSASARVGQLRARFVAEFRTAPIPQEWAKNSGPVPGGNGITYEEIRKSYYEAIDSAAAPERARARKANEKCQSDSAKFNYADALSKTCTTWLEKTS